MAEPADLRRPYNIDLARLHSDMTAVADRPAEDIPGVQIVDPHAEKVAGIVADAVVAAVDAMRADSSPADIRRAARTAALKGTLAPP